MELGLKGRIAFEPRGQNGFGYDPLFYIDDQGCTGAELSKQDKARLSHRGQAARGLAAALERAR